MATKIAYAIARESSDDRTLQNQYDNIHKVAKDFGYEIVREFGENVTGDATKKEGADPDFIEQLRIAIMKKKPDAIFCYWIDRWTRSTFKIGSYLDEFSVKPRIPIFFTKVKKWTIDPKTSAIDFDFIDDLSSDRTPKNERVNIKDRTSPQREKLGSEGYYIGHLSDGYCVRESWGTYEDGHRRKIKEIDVDDNRRKVIEDIFKYYKSGYSIGKIADLLNSENIPTTNAYRASNPDMFGHRQQYKSRDGVIKERSRAKWSGALVSQILSNPWYKGERKYRGKTLYHEAIITKEEWDEVEAMREENKKSFRSKKEATKHTFLLSSLFFCGNCGSRMYGHYTGLNNHYYCSSIDFKRKCGLTGVCKENVEGIIYDIISNKALKAEIDGTDEFIITDFFKIDKAKEKDLKERIANNNKIIAKSEAEIKRLEKSKENAVHLLIQPENSSIHNVLREEITKASNAIEEEEKKIVDCRIENKQYQHLLSSNSSIKEILKNILKDKELPLIKDLFKQAIDVVTVYNADKRDDVIRIKFKNGVESEFIYCARLLDNKYILLEKPIYYDEQTRLIRSSISPSFIVIDNDDLVFYRSTMSSIEEERKLMPNLNINDTKCISLENGVSLKDFIKMVKDTSLAIPYVRLEEKSDLALQQEEHYKHWRKKYNTGKPSGQEPYILHNETYEEIQKMRTKLYNKIYKIKQRKRLTDEEKKEQINAIKRQLAALTVQVPLIKPRKKRTTNRKDAEWEAAAEPSE